MSGKGSRPRPFSVSQDTFASNWDNIFRKKEMTPKIENMKKGTCGCGRSPTGDCIGWHGLTEEVYKEKLQEWELKQYQAHANEIWNDSCTSGRKV
jgi:hypothetical protein